MTDVQTIRIPRNKTWEVLQNSRNLAAIKTLTAGLDSDSSDMRQQCLKHLLSRREKVAREEIILKWDCYNSDEVELLRASAKLFDEIAKNLLETGDLSQKRAALSAISDLDLNDAIDVILNIIVERRHPLASQAKDCLLDMCQRWGQIARTKRDVPSIRGQMLEKLYSKLVTFHEHRNPDIVDAWLRLVHWDDSRQRGLIADPRQDVYRVVIDRLRKSQDPSHLQLLAGYLCRQATPKSVQGILAERDEPELAIAIAKLTEEHALAGVLKHLKRSAPLVCLESWHVDQHPVSSELERRLWLMLACSSENTTRILQSALQLACSGTSDSRAIAAEMIQRCRKPALDELVPAIQVSELEVETKREAQSAVVVSDRDVAKTPDFGSMSIGELVVEITKWLDSPSALLQSAAGDFLKNFSLQSLLEQVRVWPSQMCRSMARIVKQIEKKPAELLSQEFSSPAPKRRLAALQVTELLDCADEVSQWLLPLLEDERLEIRVKTIDVLTALGHEEIEQRIPELLDDANTDVQDAAARAQRRFARV